MDLDLGREILLETRHQKGLGTGWICILLMQCICFKAKSLQFPK
jgi:hypothetical protein